MNKHLYKNKINGLIKLIALSAMFTLLFGSMAFAQAIVIKGKVVDAETKETVPGATVKIKGGTTAVSTDVNGDFSISGTLPAIITVSFIGYNLKEIPVINQQVLIVNLTKSAEQLKDVVVTALGVKKENRAVGYSVSTVKGASLTEARTNSFVNGLEGKIAGVNVSGVATGPNSSTSVVIRGITSMTGSSQPLYVIDNVPLVNNNYNTTDLGGYGGRDGGDGIGDVNPDDIETISVLKGAAATALYGYRGSNGVILITTKKGKSGAGLGVEINSNYVAEKVIDETDFQKSYGQGYGGTAPVSAADAMGSLESVWGGPLNGADVYQFDGVKRPYSAVSKGNLSRFYTTGGNATNTIAFTKGFEDGSSTRFSFGDLQDKSYVPNAGLQRMTFTQTTNLKLGKNLTLDLSSAYVTEYTKNAPNVADAVGNMNWEAIFLPPNVNILTLKGPNGNGTQTNGEELNASNDAYTTNPYYSAYVLQEAQHRNRFTGSANTKYTFDSGYFIGLQVADDYIDDRITNIEPPTAAYVVDEQIGGDMSEQNVKQTELNIDLTTGKKFNITKDFSVDLLLGTNYRKSVQEYLTTSGNFFIIPNLYTVSNLEFPSVYNAVNNEEYQSIYGSADFAYKNYLYLSVTGRNDWYSTLAPGKINYFYPSVSGSFVFSELLNIPAMDLGKLRMSYANVGGAVDGPYQTLQTYGLQGTLNAGSRGNYPIGYAGGGQVPNSGLVPSSRREFEVGTEMDFFKNRLTFDLAVYRKNVIDDIVPVSIDYTSGYTSALLNVGNLRYDGIEVALGGTPFKSANFNWQINGNFAYAKGKVLSLGGQPNITLSSEASDNGASAYVQQVVGREPNQIFASYPQTDATGNIVLDPTTGAPNPLYASVRNFGSAENPWSGGLDNTFRFKHFRLGILIDGKFGGHIYSETNYWAYVTGLSKLTLNRNQLYGTDKAYASTYYGSLGSADQGMFVYSDSFIKFRQIILGYDFPATMFNNKIHGLNLSFVCRNVFTIFKAIPNVDPESSYSSEIQTQGFEAPSVPYSRTFGLNLKLTL